GRGPVAVGGRLRRAPLRRLLLRQLLAQPCTAVVSSAAQRRLATAKLVNSTRQGTSGQLSFQAQRGTCLTDLPGFPATSGMTNQGCAQVPWRPFAGRLRPWPPAQGDGATSRCRRTRLVLRDAFSRFLPFPAGLCSRDPVDRACGR